MLRNVRNGAAVLAAEAESLDESKYQQQDACRRTDLRVARHEPDERRRQPHAAQGDEECVLAANEIADTAEHESAKRPDEKSGGERPHRLDERRPGCASCEELGR